jgi:hypothetical protein
MLSPVVETPQRFISDPGEQLITVTLTKDDMWIFEKKERLLIAPLFPLPERKTEMQISDFGAVEERYIQMWQRMMPRYSRDQLRLAFTEYVQKYGWDVAVESSGCGTLERYTAMRAANKPSKGSSQPQSPPLKPTLKKMIETISPYQQKLIEERTALFQKLEMSKMGDVRRKLWYELIRIEEATGHGLSKAVSKLYASWLRTAKMRQDATLEVDEDDASVIEWGSIRINLPQLKNWVIFQLGSSPVSTAWH